MSVSLWLFVFVPLFSILSSPLLAHFLLLAPSTLWCAVFVISVSASCSFLFTVPLFVFFSIPLFASCQVAWALPSDTLTSLLWCWNRTVQVHFWHLYNKQMGIGALSSFSRENPPLWSVPRPKRERTSRGGPYSNETTAVLWVAPLRSTRKSQKPQNCAIGPKISVWCQPLYRRVWTVPDRSSRFGFCLEKPLEPLLLLFVCLHFITIGCWLVMLCGK